MKIVASRYRLEEKIGAGGEAHVFRARDLVVDQEVAIRLAQGPGFLSRVTSPALPHPGWVRLLESGIDAEHGAYQAFELLSGRTLRALVEERPLSPSDWRSFVRQSLDPVEALHTAGWIHGDLNADNFLRAGDSDWKLLELPFHRFEPLENRPPLFGSIYTLAPEQLNGARPGPLSDLYALGCLYYYAACGIFPNAGGSAQDIAVDRLRFAPAPLREKARGLSAIETNWVMRLLECAPGDRPANIDAARRLLISAALPAPRDNAAAD